MENFFSEMYSKILEFIFPSKDAVLKLEKLADTDSLSILPKPEEDFSASTNSLFSYKNNMVRELVWQVKYKNNKKLLNAVGKLLYELILDDISNKNFFQNNQSVLIPIPMSRNHRKERGFNQTEEISKAIIANDISKILFYEPNILIKTIETLQQSKTKNKKERKENLTGAFEINEAEKISGKSVILIDDVITTGSTIAEAIRVLKSAGAKRVSTYTIAH